MNYRIIEFITEEENPKSLWYLFAKDSANTRADIVGIYDTFAEANTVLTLKKEEDNSGT